jgi:hypothetical protein
LAADCGDSNGRATQQTEAHFGCFYCPLNQKKKKNLGDAKHKFREIQSQFCKFQVEKLAKISDEDMAYFFQSQPYFQPVD